MRRIEFRGKSKATGEWLYGDLLHSADGMTVSISPRKAMTDEEVCDMERFVVNPATVGQFTGLEDASGERIFEGDIVSFSTEDWYSGHYNWRKRTGEIVFVEDGCGFSILADDRYFSLTPKGIESEYLFVDGNIYDNFIPVEAEEDDEA